ncbi:MAG: hypothetical protein MZW92_54305 [Comamonadaceae bacterium]|nr:hypothetical protein [Comamonadaceae bacterium]
MPGWRSCARGADGARGIHEVEGQPLHDEAGRFVQYALLATEITRPEGHRGGSCAKRELLPRAVRRTRRWRRRSRAPTTGSLRVNAAYARLLGRPADEADRPAT